MSTTTDGETLKAAGRERHSVPEGADLGLGCGNPQTFANLRAGERVLDLGSGADFIASALIRATKPSAEQSRG